MERTCKTLSIEQIASINRRMINEFGGFSFIEPYNFKDESNSLLYILEAIHTTYFGHDFYPTIIEKGAAVGWTIIAKHVFNDAYKRTGIIVCQLFFDINGYECEIGIDDTETVEMAVATGNSKVELNEFTDWIRLHTRKII